jgi:hypothetical protein
MTMPEPGPKSILSSALLCRAWARRPRSRPQQLEQLGSESNSDPVGSASGGPASLRAAGARSCGRSAGSLVASPRPARLLAVRADPRRSEIDSDAIPCRRASPAPASVRAAAVANLLHITENVFLALTRGYGICIFRSGQCPRRAGCRLCLHLTRPLRPILPPLPRSPLRIPALARRSPVWRQGCAPCTIDSDHDHPVRMPRVAVEAPRIAPGCSAGAARISPGWRLFTIANRNARCPPDTLPPRPMADCKSLICSAKLPPWRRRDRPLQPPLPCSTGCCDGTKPAGDGTDRRAPGTEVPAIGTEILPPGTCLERGNAGVPARSMVGAPASSGGSKIRRAGS